MVLEECDNNLVGNWSRHGTHYWMSGLVTVPQWSPLDSANLS